MAPHGQRATDDEIASASHEGLMGAIHGAGTWGAVCLALGMGAHFFSPVYRNLTIQFKVYLQLSGMTVGSCIEADKRFRDAQRQNRVMRKLQRDRAVWSAYEKDWKSKAGEEKPSPDSRDRSPDK